MTVGRNTGFQPAYQDVRNYIWDTDTLAWVAQTGTSGGGANVTVNQYGSPDQPVGKIYEDGDITYICRAVIGSALSDAVWQIMKVDESSGLRITWTDGNRNYDNTATDLGTVQGHSYS